MRRREASINDVAIEQTQRKFHWSTPGPRPEDDAGIPMSLDPPTQSPPRRIHNWRRCERSFRF
jgi:hypothetical protein